MRLVGGSELARMVGVTPQAIVKASQTGRITQHSINERGHARYDLDVVLPEWEATKTIADAQNRHSHLPPAFRGGRPSSRSTTSAYDDDEDQSPDGDPTDAAKYLKAKAAREALNAKLAQIKVQTQMGELIARDTARLQGAELGAILTGALQAWPDRMADELAAMTDRREIHTLIRKEVNYLVAQIREKCGAE